MKPMSAGRNLILISLLLMASAAPGGDPPPDPALGAPGAYHVRLLRVRWDEGLPGSALFKPSEVVVPLAERELWGRPDQLGSLRRALGAGDIEALPGLIVQGEDDGPHWFRTALGEELLEISFGADELPGRWHRVRISAYAEGGAEILDAALLVQSGRTVALVAPYGAGHEAVVVAVTPMERLLELSGEIHRPGANDVTYPTLIPESRVMPEYPATARAEGLSGAVIAEVVVRADGTLDGIVVLRMPEGGEWLAGAAVEAISQWRYEPATRDGVPVDAWFTLVVEFVLK